MKIASTVTMPVMIIHGENDRRFPLDFALKLKKGFAPEQAEIYTAGGAGHSDASLKSGYKEVVKSFLDGVKKSEFKVQRTGFNLWSLIAGSWLLVKPSAKRIALKTSRPMSSFIFYPMPHAHGLSTTDNRYLKPCLKADT
ncbi:MAG: alpha/beta hydrolase [Desulfobacteraceae bacterium]